MEKFPGLVRLANIPEGDGSEFAEEFFFLLDGYSEKESIQWPDYLKDLPPKELRFFEIAGKLFKTLGSTTNDLHAGNLGVGSKGRLVVLDPG